MKILILNWRDVSHPKSGGAEIVTEEHAKAWVSQGHSVYLFTSHYPSAQTFEIKDGIQYIRKGGEYSLYFHAAFYLLFHSRKYDIIVDEIHGLPFFSFFIFQRPVVAFIHEVAGDIWDTVFPFPFNIIGKLLEPLFLRLYNARKIPFWTDSPSMMEELLSIGIEKDRCSVIPCPILYVNNRKKVQKENHPTFLFVSRLVPMKGIEDVIRAFSYIKQEEPRAVLYIVGAGQSTYVAKLKTIVNELDLDSSVIFFGKVSDDEKLSIMARSHILLHASMKEGWGLVVLEAANQGTPSIVYNVPGLRDVVRDGETGIVVKENSPEELGIQALSLFRNKSLYKKFQIQGRAWAASFTWDDVTKRSLELLEQTVRNYHSV
ncbi:MAG: glycosyltransferase family 4 protein [Patescibacteria group bacterium]|nr:glycosyltransferase family 4 protein [Patescibacteria group bacterium]